MSGDVKPIVFPVKFPLTRPITAHDKEVNELTLREPVGDDLMSIGYPYLIVTGDMGTEGIELRPKIVGKWVSRLAGIPPSSVLKISFSDLQALQGVVMSFFGQTPDATSKDSKTEPST